MSRFEDKANAVVAAWKQRYQGKVPSKHAVIMCCAVAEHETRCGDSWNNSGNWGAIQRRVMNAAERAVVLQGGTPPPSDAFEQLHGDSSPINGRYKTWFWAFPRGVTYSLAGLAGDDAGAWKLIEVLLVKRAVIAATIDTTDVQTLASNMYHTRYYEGIHDPRVAGGVDQNIQDYAHALSFTSGAFAAGLASWQPDGVAPTGTLPASGDGNAPTFDLGSVLGIQRALNALGVADPALREDGVLGPRTHAAIMLFQQSDGTLKVDGTVGPKTRDALTKALVVPR